VDIEFRRDDVTGPEVIRLLETHLAHARLHTPIEQVFALDLDGLRGGDMHFWTGWLDDDLVTMGGLRVIESHHGEIKSMHTIERLRGQGIAGRMLDFLIAEARSMDLKRMSLETGSQAAYAPARGLYASRDFAECGPLPGYPESEWSAFMTRLL
jgi:putative acetyltransferase